MLGYDWPTSDEERLFQLGQLWVEFAPKLEAAGAAALAVPALRAQTLAAIAEREIQAARELHQLQVADSRIGFEATNQYYYVPIDLVEKVLVCESIIDRLSR